MTAAIPESNTMNSEGTTNKKIAGKQRNLESRKIRKPLMEKRRRARINHSLNELKRILLEANGMPNRKEGTSRPSKLEKADILELTVQHLQLIHSQSTGLSSNYADSSEDDSSNAQEAKSLPCTFKNLAELKPIVSDEEEHLSDNHGIIHQCTATSPAQDEEDELVFVIKRSSIGFLKSQAKSSLVLKSKKGNRGDVLFLQPSHSTDTQTLISACDKQGTDIWRPW